MPRRTSRTIPSLALALFLGLAQSIAAWGKIGTWTELAPLPFANSEFGAAVIDGRVYAAGGFLASNHPRLAIYDPQADAWSEGPDLPVGTHHAGVVALGGKLYVVGGEEANDQLQIYDPRAGEWSLGTGLLRPRNSMAAVVLDGRIHAIGGGPNINQGGAWTDHEVYDPATDTWESRAPLPVAGEHILGAALGGKIYVAGGRDSFFNRDNLQIYDPATDTWTQGAPMPNARSGHAAVALDGRIYAFGGEDIPGGTVLSAAERYDPATGSWEAVTNVPAAVHGVAGVVVDGGVLLIGGSRAAASGAGTRNVYRLDLPSRRPARPTNLRASRVKRKRLRLAWDDNSDNEDTFVVQRKAPGGRFETILELGADVTRVVVKGLEAGTTYRFRVRALDGDKRSRFSNRVRVTTK